MILLLSTLGSQATISLRDMLMGVPYVLCVIGIVENLWRDEDKPKAVLNSILVTIIVVGLIYGFPAGLEKLRNSFSDLRNQFNQTPLLEKLYSAEAGDAPSKFNVGDYICYTGVLFLQRLGYFSIF